MTTLSMMDQLVFPGLAVIILVVMSAVALYGFIKRCEKRRKEGGKLGTKYWLAHGILWLVLPIALLYGTSSILVGFGYFTR